MLLIASHFSGIDSAFGAFTDCAIVVKLMLKEPLLQARRVYTIQFGLLRSAHLFWTQLDERPL
jgi:hypothetical protein